MAVRAVVGILKKGDKVLVAKRPEGKPYSGYWEFPGGKIESHEIGAQALKRELNEELGIQIKSAQYCFDHEHVYPDKVVQLEMWLVTDFEGDPEGRENQELRWVTLPEIHDLKLLEGNWPLLDRIKGLLV